MGQGPVHFGDDRWALWSSVVDDWTSSIGTREEAADMLILDRFESAVNDVDRTFDRAMEFTRRGYSAKDLVAEYGQPPTDEEIDAQEGSEPIPAEVMAALQVIKQYSRDYYASIGARLASADSEPREPVTEVEKPTETNAEASDAELCGDLECEVHGYEAQRDAAAAKT